MRGIATCMASTLQVQSLAFWRASLSANTLGRYAGMFLASITMLSSVTMLWRGLGNKTNISDVFKGKVV